VVYLAACTVLPSSICLKLQSLVRLSLFTFADSPTKIYFPGMHSIVDRAHVVNGKIEIRPIMVVALTYDHRLLDGREAVTFLGVFQLPL
jgi:hypothetical protein